VITDLAFSPDGTFLASVSGIAQGDVVYRSDNTLRIWDTRSGTELATFPGVDHLNSVAVSPDSKFVATGSINGVIQLWSLQDKAEIAQFIGNDTAIESLVFSKDGDLLFAGAWDHLIHVWDVNGKKEIRTLKGHLDWIEQLVLNGAGTLLASASGDGTVRIWGIDIPGH
jgi:WD40 repeat protein